MNTPTIDWRQRAAALQFDGRAFIAGRRVAAHSGQTFDCISPLDGRVLTQVARGGTADIDAAVGAARAAFADGRWAHKAPAQRKRVLLRFAEKIIAAKDELALLETLDMGKPVQHSLGVDVQSASRCIAWYAEAVDKVYDEVAPTARNALALIRDVDAIGFTGSTRVGRKMLEYAGRSNLKRVYNELGGKSAFIVFPDFEDLQRAATTVAGSMFFNQGESCNAPSRVFVDESVAERFVEIVAAEAPKYMPGDPLSGSAGMGAIVD